MKNARAFRVYLTLSIASTFFNATMFTVLTVYYVTVGGLNPFQLVLVGTIMEVATFLFEIPTGIVADVYSRRLSVIIGTFITGAAFIFIGFVASFATIAIGLAIWGIGSTFLSGAREAWIVDEVGDDQISYIFLRATQFRRVASFVGTFVSVGLANISLELPLIVGGGGTLLLGVYLIFVMPETGFHPSTREEHNPLQQMGSLFKESLQVVSRGSILRWFLILGIFYGAYAEAWDCLGDAHFLFNFTFPLLGNFEPVVWFGIFTAGGQLLGFVAAGAAARWLRMEQTPAILRTLALLQLLWIGATLVFALASSFYLALAAYWAVGIVRTVHGPLYNSWLNQQIDSLSRATVLSVFSQSDSFGQLTGGPLLGWVGTIFSLRVAMVAATLALVPAVGLFAKVSPQFRSAFDNT